MKAQLIRPASDLHLEHVAVYHIEKFLDMVIPPLPEDKDTVLCLCGDIGLAHYPATWYNPLCYLSKRFLAVICIEGNHFFWGNNAFDNTEEHKAYKVLRGKPDNVFFLERRMFSTNKGCGIVEINGISFLGGTLWTSMCNENETIIKYMDDNFADYSNMNKTKFGKRLHPRDTVAIFNETVEFIFDSLNSINGKSVILTHHAPSPKSIIPAFRGNILNPAFADNLEAEILEFQPTLWLHGHTHSNSDYMIGNTRVMSNQCGYLTNPNMYYDNKLQIAI